MKIYIDITNYVITRSHTGIQRVIREFIFNLLDDEISFKYAIIYFDIDEQLFIQISENDILLFLADIKKFKLANTLNKVSLMDFREKDIFFDMDANWNFGLIRTFLYKELKKNKVTIINFIYDLVPIIKPQYSHKNTIVHFTTYLYAIYKYSDLVLFDSRSAEKDFIETKQNIGLKRNIHTKVVKLGSDIQLITPKQKIIYENIISSKYILFVGTLEPRKNHALVLKVFEKLERKFKDIKLVFIGKEGWNNTKLIDKIKKHPLLNSKLLWLNNVNDEELIQLYKHAYLCTYISEYEGFGLPIAESLGHNQITITSNNSSMFEVGKNFADYVTYNSFNELYEIFEMYLNNERLYQAKKQYISDNYRPYTWKLTYSSIITVFQNFIQSTPIKSPQKLQFVFISIDIENLKDTIISIDQYIDFVSEYIIVTKANMIDKFKKINSKYPITVINEDIILQKHSKDFHKRDHVSKNWLLRTSLLNLNILDDQFIMLDDDNRPLQKISIDHYIKDGKYNAYYFYDLLHWHSYKTDYDFAQHHMKKILDNEGFELLSYSSHKPQIIDKKIFKEVVEKFFDLGLKLPIDEWSIYFNYAISCYPHLFNKIQYDTLNWPDNPSHWKMQYIPDIYNFENFYSSVYIDGLYKNNVSNYENKILIKKKQLEPYIYNQQRKKLLNKDYFKYNIVHGVMQFKFLHKEVYILSLPYYFESKKGSWLKVTLNYKALNCYNSNVQIMYFINGDKGHHTPLYVNNNYEDNNVEFAISCMNLHTGEYNLFIDIIIDNKSVYGKESPYMIKLKITG